LKERSLSGEEKLKRECEERLKPLFIKNFPLPLTKGKGIQGIGLHKSTVEGR